MSNLICGRTLDFDLLYSAHRVYRPYADSSRAVEPGEPIHVDVRVRPLDDTGVCASWSRSGSLDPRTLPIGSNLDCYM